MVQIVVECGNGTLARFGLTVDGIHTRTFEGTDDAATALLRTTDSELCLVLRGHDAKGALRCFGDVALVRQLFASLNRASEPRSWVGIRGSP